MGKRTEEKNKRDEFYIPNTAQNVYRQNGDKEKPTEGRSTFIYQ